MTTVVQQPSSATFGPSNDNNSFLGVSVSKMKQKSPTTLSTNLTFNSSQLSKQIAASANVPSTETNGSVSSHNSTSPRPHTTSQVIPCVIITGWLADPESLKNPENGVNGPENRQRKLLRTLKVRKFYPHKKIKLILSIKVTSDHFTNCQSCLWWDVF